MKINPVIKLISLFFLSIIITGCSAKNAALVNGQPISQTEFQKELGKRYGQKVLNDLIIQRLVEQEARKKKAVAKKEELERRFNYLLASYSSEKELGKDLKERGLTRDDLKKQLRFQIMAEKLLKPFKEPSETRLKKQYEQLKDTQFKGKSYKEVRDQIRQSYISFQVGQKLPALVLKLRREAKVIDFLKPEKGKN